MDIEVAPLVRDTTYLDVPAIVLEASGPEVPWERRPKAVVHVNLDATINTVIEKAAQSFDVRVRPSQYFERETGVSELIMKEVVFYAGEPDAQIATLALVEADGSAYWNIDPNEATFADILAAKDADVFLGDPSRMYLLIDKPLLPVGNGYHYWSEALRALMALHDYVKAVGSEIDAYVEIGGAIYAFSRVIRHFGLNLRGDINKYAQLFKIPRTSEQVATLLKVPEENVPSIMHFFGFQQTGDGYWRAINEPHRQELVELGAVIDIAGRWYMSEEVLSKGLREILALPAGERSKQADGIFRRLRYEEWERDYEGGS
jgi:hypothetical protein